MTDYFIKNNPKYYIGISSEWLWFVNFLHLQTGINASNASDIQLTLIKIKLNDTFSG